MGDGAVERTDDTDVLQGAPLVMRLQGGAWRVPTADSWKDERSLQEIVAENPTILPGVASPDAATVLEFPIYDMGRVDVLCVEQDGTLTVCEVKLRRNPEIRRQVLGQVLAYAAGLTAMSFDEVDREWFARKGATLVSSVLGADPDPADVETFKESVAARLQAGRFRLVLAVDELTDELRSTIDYLAQHTDADVDLLALEVSYTSHGDVEILVPRAWGVASTTRGRTARPGSSKASRIPLEEAAAILEASENAHPGAGRIVEELLTRLGPRLSYLYVGNPDRLVDQGCVVTADNPVQCHPLAIRPGLRSPGIRIGFDWMRGLGGERLEGLLVALEAHPVLAGLLTEVRDAGFRKRPLIPFEVLEDQAVLDLVISEIYNVLRPLAEGEEVTPVKAGSFDRGRLHDLMAAVPAGRWVTYGDLAELSGTGAQALGAHIRSCSECPHAARVLPGNGRPSEGFKRIDATDQRTQRAELESEGIRFVDGVADPAVRISGEELAELVPGSARP